MQKLITKYGLAAHLALLAVAPLVLSPSAVLWLSALALMWLIMEPSRVGTEMLHDARARVTWGVLRDPVFWTCLALVVLCGLRALNDGVALVYDAEMARWTLTKPVMTLVPGCMSGSGFPLFASMVAAGIVLTGCRNALGRSARFAFVLVASVLVGCICVSRVYDARFSAAVVIDGCSVNDPSYFGSVAGVCWLISLSSLVAVFERRWWLTLPFAMVAVAGTALGLFFFAPALVTVVVLAVGLAFALYSSGYLYLKSGGTTGFKYLAVICVAIAAGIIFAHLTVPSEAVDAKVEAILSGRFLDQDTRTVRSALSALSLEIWKQSPWLGSGLGSFQTAMGFSATPEDWAVISPLQKAPLNGYWLLLVERGIIGVALMFLPFVLVLITYVGRLLKGYRALPHPLCILGPLALVLAFAEMSIDCSFLMTGVFMLMLAVFSLSAQTFSKETGTHVG